MNGIENKVDCWSMGSRDTRDTLRTMDGNTMSFTNSFITLHTVNTMRAGNRLHVSKTTVRLFKAVMLVTKALMAMSFELIGAVALAKVELNFFLAFRFGFRLNVTLFRIGTAWLQYCTLGPPKPNIDDSTAL